MGIFKDITGNVYGELTVLKYVRRNEHRQSVFECICSCGIVIETLSCRLINGRKTSCGCKSGKCLNHGLSHTRIHNIYRAMIDRCTNKNSENYKYYGAKGRSVEFENFIDFYDWSMKNGYNDIFEIDRIDNDGNYSKGNCRWVTVQENIRYNRKGVQSNNKTGYAGISIDGNKYVANIRIFGKHFYLGKHKTIEEAYAARKKFVEEYEEKQDESFLRSKM